MDKWRYLAIGVCLVTTSGVAFADSIDAQRQRYQQVKLAGTVIR